MTLSIAERQRREKGIIRFWEKGYHRKEIAKALGLSRVVTVKWISKLQEEEKIKRRAQGNLIPFSLRHQRIKKIQRLLKQGLSLEDIATIMKRSVWTIYRWRRESL